MATQTIFYVNSMGFMSQWKGTVICKDETSISIRFSKNRAFKYNLKDMDISFCLVTNKQVKDLGVCVSKNMEFTCFDESLIETVISKTVGNVHCMWRDGKWQA